MNFYKFLGLIFIYIFSFGVTNATLYEYPQYNDRYIYDDLNTVTQYCIEKNETYVSHIGGLNPYNPYYYNGTWQTTGSFAGGVLSIICETTNEPPTETGSTNTGTTEPPTETGSTNTGTTEPPTETGSTNTGSTIIINNYDDTPIFSKDFLDDVYISILVIVSIFLGIRFFYILK